MLTIFKDRLIHIEWTIFKGTSNVREDFTRALVKCFLIGPREKYLVEATAKDGTLFINLPQGLEEGAYSIEVIYVKNQGNLTPRREPLSPSNALDYRRTPYPPFTPHDARFNDRCIMRSRRDCLFAITEYEQEEEGVPTASSGEVTLRFNTSTASYGYDGLSAYEIAVMRGDFNGTEGQYATMFLIPTASDKVVGGIKAEKRTENETTEAKIDPNTGKLYVSPIGVSKVFLATKDLIGGIKAEEKTEEETLEAKIDPNTGRLYVPDKSKSADNEDLVQYKDENIQKEVLKFADKEYSEASFSGLGRAYLRKNISASKNVLTQAMVNRPNTRYVVQYDYDLNAQTISVPEECELDFQGGILRNGTLSGEIKFADTIRQIFNNVSFAEGSTLVCDYVRPEWFGAKGDGVTDDTEAFNQIMNSFKSGIEIRLLNKTYCITKLDFYKYTDFAIIGYGNNSAHSTTRKSKLKALYDVDYLISVTSPTYQDSIATTYGFCIKNIEIDCDNKAENGIRCRYMLDMYNVAVRRATDTGVVLDEESYPVTMDKVYLQWNKNGMVIKSPRTTYCTFRDCEFQFNTGWGVIIQGGTGLTFYSCLVQANWVGGIKIEQVEGEQAWLQNLLFVSLYMEGNGRRPTSADDYEGNYSLLIKGLSDNPAAYANKIAKILFINSQFNKYSTGQLYKIEGTYDCKFINCAPSDIVPDRTKNTWNTDNLGRAYAEYLTLRDLDPKIVFPTDSETVGVYYNELKYHGGGWKQFKLGVYDTQFFNIENVSNGYFVRNGKVVTVILRIKYLDKNDIGGSGYAPDAYLPLCISSLPFPIYSPIKSDGSVVRCSCGNGFLHGDDNVKIPVDVIVYFEGNYVMIQKQSENKELNVRDIPDSGIISANFTYFTNE